MIKEILKPMFLSAIIINLTNKVFSHFLYLLRVVKYLYSSVNYYYFSIHNIRLLDNAPFFKIQYDKLYNLR